MLFKNIPTLHVFALALSIRFGSAEETLSAPQSVVTEGPPLDLVRREIERRDYGDLDFIGYYSDGTTFSGRYCLGNQWTTISDYGEYYGGCQGTDSYVTLYTTCSAGTAFGSSFYLSGLYTGSSYLASSVCSGTCVYNEVNSNLGYSSWYIRCQADTATTFWRVSSTEMNTIFATFNGGGNNIPTPTVTKTIPPSPQPTTITEIGTTPTRTTAPTPISGSSSTSSTTPPSPVPTHKKKSSLAGPIAGGVVGGIALIAGIIVAVLLILKKKKRKTGGNVEGMQQPVEVVQPGYQPGYQPNPNVPIGVIPEKATVSPVVSQYPNSPPQNYPQTYPQNYPQEYPQQNQPQAFAPQGSPPVGHSAYAPTSPPGSPPPPGYFNNPPHELYQPSELYQPPPQPQQPPQPPHA